MLECGGCHRIYSLWTIYIMHYQMKTWNVILYNGWSVVWCQSNFAFRAGVDLYLQRCTFLLVNFHPRNALLARSLPSKLERRLATVLLSVTRRYCVQTAKPILKLFGPSGSPIILVFLPVRRYRIPRRTRQRGTKFTGVGKFCEFRLKSLSFSETVRDRPMVTMER